MSTSTGISLRGLDLAEQRFGPLLSPITATPSDWEAYVENRLKTKERYGSRHSESDEEGDDEELNYGQDDWDVIKKSLRYCMKEMEADMGLPAKSLLKCVEILICRNLRLDGYEPLSVETLSRIYSPTRPAYIDVHFFYYSQSRYYEFEWGWSLGYKICLRPEPKVAEGYGSLASIAGSGVSTMHRNGHGGWQRVGWGKYDDSPNNHGPRWRRIELGQVDLSSEGPKNIYEALFGELEPLSDNADEATKTAHRRKLVQAVRLILASVGVSYKMACTDEEEDEGPDGGGYGSSPNRLKYILEGARDPQVARGVRRACGFQLTRDPTEKAEGDRMRAEAAQNQYDN
ncbi:hypothetical protein HYDPIDRAFT_31507 [Hydnomerulius pinastri MD-312]|uniref:Uncharacterized protein n=1 Tax=Hydnomerulius pinastri MD-312 TaxID=994086 RepID=A0A0C9W4A3_9AGAM|nr:hypothetical protein HYDPIDRAFT_31507 [Hydnomerulius pinastri MD-312]